MKKTIIHLLAFAATLVSCTKETPAIIPGEKDVAFDIPIDIIVDLPESTKSSMTIGNDVVNNITFLVFNEGLLMKEYRFEPPFSDATLQLLSGRKYRFYAFANRSVSDKCEENASFWSFVDGDCNDGRPRTTEKDMDRVLQFYASVEDINDSGMPMSYVSPDDWSFESHQGSSVKVSIPFKRLAARYRLNIDKSQMKKGDVVLSEASVRQAPYRIAPFAKESRMDNRFVRSYNASDYATVLDINNLNENGSAEFFVLENRMGELLEGNTDPSRKTWDNLKTEDAELCTYLELKGSYNSYDGIRSDISMRFFLGQNTYSNFDIIRNTVTDITLTLTDSGVFAGTWKVEMDNITSDRVLSFSEENHGYVEIAHDYSDTLCLRVYPNTLDYTVTVLPKDAEAYGLEVESVGDDRYVIRSSYTGMHKVVFPLIASTWDGLIKDEVDVVIDNIPFTTFDVSYDGPDMTTGTWHKISFPSSISKRPVTANGLSVEDLEKGSVTEEGFRIYFCPEDNGSAYVFCEKEGEYELDAAQTRKGQTANIKVALNIKNPLTVSSCESVSVLEDGRESAKVNVSMKDAFTGVTLNEGFFTAPDAVARNFEEDVAMLFKNLYPACVITPNDIYDADYTEESTAGLEYAFYGLEPKDTVAIIGWKGLAEQSVNIAVDSIRFPEHDRITIDYSPFDVGADRLPRTLDKRWISVDYPHAQWRLQRCTDIFNEKMADAENDLLCSCVAIDTFSAKEPVISLLYPEMKSEETTETIDQYAAYPSGAYRLWGCIYNERSGKLKYRQAYDFDVVTTIPLGIYMTFSPMIPEAVSTDMRGSTIRIDYKIVPMDYRFHKSYRLWNKTLGPVSICYQFDGGKVTDWSANWGSVNVRISDSLINELQGMDFPQLEDWLYNRLDLQGAFDFQIQPGYVEQMIIQPEPVTTYLLDRAEIVNNKDIINYNGNRGFYKFIKADALYSDEDAKRNIIVNMRFNDWSDVYEGDKYDWLYW